MSERSQRLAEFEASLDPARPEAGVHSPKVIGYGEMSTVFTFQHPALSGFAYKRMPPFGTEGEARAYLDNYLRYGQLLTERGLRLPEQDGFVVPNPRGRTVLYLSQGLLAGERIAHKVVRKADEAVALRVFERILEQLQPFFAANREALALGLDAQLSNWCLEEAGLIYLDTSTPLIRENGAEAIDPELFLKVCPQSLVWIIRRFFLQGVLDRYYDLRLVVLDLIANLKKERRTDLVDAFLSRAAPFLSAAGCEPIARRDVDSYYREDALIWRLFLGLRRLERGWRRLWGRQYELILPGPIAR